jgi:hypothetical protein
MRFSSSTVLLPLLCMPVSRFFFSCKQQCKQWYTHSTFDQGSAKSRQVLHYSLCTTPTNTRHACIRCLCLAADTMLAMRRSYALLWVSTSMPPWDCTPG